MKFLFLLCALLHILNNAHAQREERNRFPQAILVQLSSEHNRMKGLEKARAYDDLAQLKKDAAAVAEKMRLDFKENFTMYPVYFYIDTNLEKIKSGNFTDVLTDAEGYLMETTELGDSSRDFFIVYYGYPKFTKRKPKRIKSGSEDAHTFDTPTGKYLVVCNHNLEQITYVQRRRVDVLPPEDKKYLYNSPRFDIGYRPAVKKLPGLLTGLSLNYQ